MRPCVQVATPLPKRRGKWVKASLMLVNRTRRRKKFLELAIWEVFYRRKRGLMNVDTETARTAATLFSVSGLSAVRRQYFLIKEDLTESFHLERRRI